MLINLRVSIPRRLYDSCRWIRVITRLLRCCCIRWSMRIRFCSIRFCWYNGSNVETMKNTQSISKNDTGHASLTSMPRVDRESIQLVNARRY